MAATGTAVALASAAAAGLTLAGFASAASQGLVDHKNGTVTTTPTVAPTAAAPTVVAAAPPAPPAPPTPPVVAAQEQARAAVVANVPLPAPAATVATPAAEPSPDDRRTEESEDPRTLVQLVDAAVAVAKVEAAKPPPDTLFQKASKVRLFANTRDWYAKRIADYTARRTQGGARRTLRRGGASSAIAPFVAAIKKKLAAISDKDQKPQVAFSHLLSAGGVPDDAEGDKVATLLLPVANTFTRWRFAVRSMSLRYSPATVADAEDLYADIRIPQQIQRIFAANDSEVYKIKFPPSVVAPPVEELATEAAAAAAAVATDTSATGVVSETPPGPDNQEFPEPVGYVPAPDVVAAPTVVAPAAPTPAAPTVVAPAAPAPVVAPVPTPEEKAAEEARVKSLIELANTAQVKQELAESAERETADFARTQAANWELEIAKNRKAAMDRAAAAAPVAALAPEVSSASDETAPTEEERASATEAERQLREAIGDTAANDVVSRSGNPTLGPEPPASPPLPEGLAERLTKAKAKYEEMTARTQKLEKSVSKKNFTKPPVKKSKPQYEKPVTETDLTAHYAALRVQASKRAVQDTERMARRMKRGQVPAVPPQAPDTTDADLAEIEKDLDAAETTVGEFKALLETLRQEDVLEEDKQWIANADMELELQLDYLSQVERNLADVPDTVAAPLPVPPVSVSATSTQPPLTNFDKELDSLRSQLAERKKERSHAGLSGTPGYNRKDVTVKALEKRIAQIEALKGVAGKGGRRRNTPRRHHQGRHKRPSRKSTFRRNRKH